MDFTGVLQMLGGVGLFLFGMSLMGDGLKKAAGNKMEMILWRLSSTPLKGTLLGLLVTAVIQSSSATTVMAVSFVNAGMMTVSQSVGVIMGANIGTTATGWVLILSDLSGSGLGQFFSSTTVMALMALVGIILYMFVKRNSAKHFGTVLLGLAVLFSGMASISDAVRPLRSSPVFIEMLTMFSNPIVGIIAGIIIAAILQSVSASVGILQVLSVTGVLTLGNCMPIILGMSLGASSPILFTMLGSDRNGKRAGLTYVVYNFLGIFICMLIYYPLRALTGLEVMNTTAEYFNIAVLNTVLKVVTTLVLLPLHRQVTKLLYLFIPDDPEETADMADIEKLEESLLKFPPVALEQCANAFASMIRISKACMESAIGLMDNYDREIAAQVDEKENLVDKYEDKLGSFVMKLSGSNLTEQQRSATSKMLSAVTDLERISDQAVNIKDSATELMEKKISFSDAARFELELLFDAVTEIVELSTTSFLNSDYNLARTVEPLEQVIDELHDELRRRHVSRLQAGECSVSTGFVFNDILSSCERLSDHCSNIAVCTMEAQDKTLTQHSYSIHASETKIYRESYRRFSHKYLSPLEEELPPLFSRQ